MDWLENMIELGKSEITRQKPEEPVEAVRALFGNTQPKGEMPSSLETMARFAPGKTSLDTKEVLARGREKSERGLAEIQEQYNALTHTLNTRKNTMIATIESAETLALLKTWESNTEVQVPIEWLPFFNDIAGLQLQPGTTYGVAFDGIEDSLTNGDLTHTGALGTDMLNRVNDLGANYPEELSESVGDFIQTVCVDAGFFI